MKREIWPVTKLLRNSFEGLTLQRNKDTDISFLVLAVVSEAWNLSSHLAAVRGKMRAVAEADHDTGGVKLNQKMNQPESCTISESFALADNKMSSRPVRLDFICCEIMKFLVL